MKAFLQHRFNVLHIYSRLCPLIGRRMARAIAMAWEHTSVYRALYA